MGQRATGLFQQSAKKGVFNTGFASEDRGEMEGGGRAFGKKKS